MRVWCGQADCGRGEDGKFPEVDAGRQGIARALLDWKTQSQFSADADWVFASPWELGRHPVGYTYIGESLAAAAKEAGLGHISSHSFRHSYRSWLDALGVPIAVRQKLMRHADIRTTMNLYGDVVTQQESEALSRIAALTFNKQHTRKTGELKKMRYWGGRWESNPQRPEPQSGALPVELLPPDLSIITS
jgi:Phage integrase family